MVPDFIYLTSDQWPAGELQVQSFFNSICPGEAEYIGPAAGLTPKLAGKPGHRARHLPPGPAGPRLTSNQYPATGCPGQPQAESRGTRGLAGRPGPWSSLAFGRLPAPHWQCPARGPGQLEYPASPSRRRGAACDFQWQVAPAPGRGPGPGGRRRGTHGLPVPAAAPGPAVPSAPAALAVTGWSSRPPPGAAAAPTVAGECQWRRGVPLVPQPGHWQWGPSPRRPVPAVPVSQGLRSDSESATSTSAPRRAKKHGSISFKLKGQCSGQPEVSLQEPGAISL